jgi:hypothetical protein
VPPAPYDRRFFAVFVTQLEERHWPSFPSSAWWSALRFADREQAYTRACTGSEPLLSRKVHVRKRDWMGRNTDWRTLSLVKTAADRWWRKYGRL